MVWRYIEKAQNSLMDSELVNVSPYTPNAHRRTGTTITARKKDVFPSTAARGK